MNHNPNLIKELQQIPFYQQYPHMCPFVGKQYGKISKKIIFLGESHYVPQNSVVSLNPTKWYNGNEKDLNADEIEFIGTFDLINNRRNQELGAPAWRYYLDMEKCLIAAGFPLCENMFQYVSFMNLFQRPAVETGKSIVICPEDIEKSSEIINKAIKIIDPDIAIFFTTKGYNTFHNIIADKKIQTIRGCHTTSPWWNRDNGYGVPREICTSMLQKTLK